MAHYMALRVRSAVRIQAHPELRTGWVTGCLPLRERRPGSDHD